ncbi:MAG: hypothetical protein FWH53_06435 [Leptospirales bacterium]|nr:hypothetical protein [Leptospirales bacterium]
MPRRKELTVEEIKRKELINGFIKSAAVKNPADLQTLLKQIPKILTCTAAWKFFLTHKIGLRYFYKMKIKKAVSAIFF